MSNDLLTHNFGELLMAQSEIGAQWVMHMAQHYSFRHGLADEEMHGQGVGQLLQLSC